MINLRFSITNPWSDKFENLFSRAGKTPFKHKFWEFQFMRTDEIACVDVRYTIRQDHSGLDLWFGLFSYSVNFKI